MALSDRPRGRGHTRTTRRRRSHASSFAVALAFLLSLFARARAAEEGGVVDDASSFEGPADPEAEALSKAWGPEETFVVLPRLESLRGDGDVPWIEQISWSPRAQVYHNFLTPEECDHLVEMARPRMSVASVVDKKTGAPKPSDVRTSTGHFIRRAEDDVVRRIEERIAAFAMVPVDHGEGIQILRYERGQKYDPHFDYFTDDENVKHGGQRVATVLMYLSDVERGGETVFPRGERVGKEYEAAFKSGSRSSANDAKDAAALRERERFPSACAAGKLHVAPRKGSALLFWSVDPTGHDDPKSLHGGCAVDRGEKWTATKWLRHGPYGAEREQREKARIRRARGTDDDEKSEKSASAESAKATS
jgi:prolyl 4-hydroxylase